MTEKIRSSISATIAEIEQNDMASMATDPDDCEAYEIVRRIMRQIERNRTQAALEPETSTKV